MHGSIAGGLAWAIISVLSASGYIGLIGLMAAESACIPLPSEIILPFGTLLLWYQSSTAASMTAAVA